MFQNIGTFHFLTIFMIVDLEIKNNLYIFAHRHKYRLANDAFKWGLGFIRRPLHFLNPSIFLKRSSHV